MELLPSNPRRWPDDWRYMLDERESIMLESGVENARYLAVIDTRKLHEIQSQEPQPSPNA